MALLDELEDLVSRYGFDLVSSTLELTLPRCVFCKKIAEWEGWHRQSGLRRRVAVCEEHRELLITDSHPEEE